MFLPRTWHFQLKNYRFAHSIDSKGDGISIVFKAHLLLEMALRTPFTSKEAHLLLEMALRTLFTSKENGEANTHLCILPGSFWRKAPAWRGVA